MIIRINIYIKNIMKINNISLLIINILMIQILFSDSVDYQKKSLNEIKFEIESLESELEQQIETQKKNPDF